MKKTLLLFVLAIIILGAWKTGLLDQITFENLKTQQNALKSQFLENPLKMGLIFFGVYVASTALSLPGATVLTLAAGAIFGFSWGLLVVSFASSLGATMAFLLARYLFRDLVERKFYEKVQSLDEGVKKSGAYYLFSLRLIPAIPFFVINFGMGLTKMRALTFYIVSQVGMLPGTIIYVNAGTQLGEIERPSGILSFGVIISFVLLGLFPLMMRKLVAGYRSRKLYANFKKPSHFDYNLVVIGAGSAGLVSSLIGATVRSKVALIERDKMGGDCLNTGCVPSKALIKAAKLNSLGGTCNFPLAMEKVKEAVKKIAPHDSIERYTGLGVGCFKGEASLISPWEVSINGQILTTKSIILATGAEPVVPTLPGIDLISYKTSESLWDLDRLPKELVVLGGGNIGVEMAQAFARLGSKVTLIEKGERLLPREDPEVSDFLLQKFRFEGIVVLLKHQVVGFTSGSVQLEGEVKSVSFDECLLALGRKARTNIRGLSTLGIEVAERGTFDHDEKLQTKYPNIFVAGDCAGPYQLTHVAAHQAWYASVNALFSPFKSFKVDYRVVPWCTFSDPEIARVGLNEIEAKERKIAYEVTCYGLDDLDRAITEGEDQGFIKVLTPPGKDKILGVTIVGAHAGEQLAEFTLAMKWNLGLNKILSTIHPYPTYSEGAKYAAGVWKKNHKPERILSLLEKYHQWRRG